MDFIFSQDQRDELVKLKAKNDRFRYSIDNEDKSQFAGQMQSLGAEFTHDNVFMALQDDEAYKEFKRLHNITDSDVEEHIEFTRLINYLSKIRKCNGCCGIANCQQEQGFKGYQPTLQCTVHVNQATKKQEVSHISLGYTACPFRKRVQAETLKDANLTIIGTDLRRYDKLPPINTPERNALKQELYNRVEKWHKGESFKGLYICGSYGIGKSYTTYHFARWAANRYDVKVMYVYYPEFIRMCLSNLDNSNYTDWVDTLAKADILILDDLGAEINSRFSRDNVLLAMLQRRLDSGDKITFFNANYRPDAMEKHFSIERSNVDAVASGRVMERIKALSSFYEFTGKDLNYDE